MCCQLQFVTQVSVLKSSGKQPLRKSRVSMTALVQIATHKTLGRHRDEGAAQTHHPLNMC